MSVAEIDGADAEEAVRNYLQLIADPRKLVDTEETARLQRALEEADDPIEKLKHLAALEKARRPDLRGYEDAFIRAASTWAETNEIPGAVFLELGVKRDVLRAAGLLEPGRSRPAATNARAAGSTSVAEVKQCALTQSGVFSLSDLKEAVGGSPMTLRKALNDLIKDGLIERLGADPEWKGIGRAPHRFRRV